MNTVTYTGRRLTVVVKIIKCRLNLCVHWDNLDSCMIMPAAPIPGMNNRIDFVDRQDDRHDARVAIV